MDNLDKLEKILVEGETDGGETSEMDEVELSSNMAFRNIAVGESSMYVY